MILLVQKTASQISSEIANRVRSRRKEKKLTQSELAEKAGVSFASYKRFEQKHEIALDSLIKIALALDSEDDFDTLFSRREFSSIQELIASEKSREKEAQK